MSEPSPAPGATGRQIRDLLGLMPEGGPAICNFAITNLCNAACDFCGYARDRLPATAQRMADTERALKAIDILHARGVRYLTFTGGEPTLHRGLPALIAHAVALGLRASVVTNGFTLRQERIEALAAAGLRTLFISIDAPTAAAHENNRGLKGVAERIRASQTALAAHGVKTVASVTINRLIDDYDSLCAFLTALGFSTVTFSYPKRIAHSSSRVFSASSALIDYSDQELIEAFTHIRALKSRFAVLNSDESLAEMIRHLRGEPELFPCFGGFRYFYLDYNFDVFRCDYLPERMCTIEDFPATPAIRDGCTQCMSDCYRDASVMLAFPVALADALAHIRRGAPLAALRTLGAESTRRSVAALVHEWQTLKKHARTG